MGSPCKLYSLWALWFSLSNYHTLGCFISFGERGRVITFFFKYELKMGFCQCYCCCISESNSSDALSPCTPVGLEDRPVGAVVIEDGKESELLFVIGDEAGFMMGGRNA